MNLKVVDGYYLVIRAFDRHDRPTAARQIAMCSFVPFLGRVPFEFLNYSRFISFEDQMLVDSFRNTNYVLYTSTLTMELIGKINN